MTTLMDYQNRPVRLTDERLTHILLHAEMVGMEAALADTLKNPQLVRQSKVMKRLPSSIGSILKPQSATNGYASLSNIWLMMHLSSLPISQINLNEETIYGSASKSLV